MDPFIGEIIMFGGNFAPRGWALCQGQLLAISQNTALFSILGTTYGGDGRTTFALPDLRGRVAISQGNGPGLSSRPLGQKAGNETNTLNVTQMPSHNHAVAVQVNSGAGGESDPTGFLAGASIYAESASPGAHLGGVTVGNTGSNASINNMQPYTVVNYIIALQGVFPSRN